MKIDLKQVFDIVGESRSISYTIEADELSYVQGYSFASPVRIEGRVYNRAGVVCLDYNVACVLDITCDRCLKELERDFSYDFEHIIVQSLSGAENDNDEYIIAEGKCIEMNDIAVTDLIPELPTKLLCSEECRGLCMVCGCDLNERICEHMTDVFGEGDAL